MTTPPVIFYRYDASPFSHKIDHALLFKGIPYSIVNVSPMLPRPEITEQLGIVYRRIPIVAIGNDVYCDTSLIVSVLERRFSQKDGYGTLFPSPKHGGSPHTGLIKAFSKFYVDNTLFGPATGLLDWSTLPEAFLKDRSAFRGAPINTEAMKAAREPTLSLLLSHLALLEEQLSDGREWLFETTPPSLADVSVYFLFAWIKSFKTASAPLFEDVPFTLKWLARMSDEIQKRKGAKAGPNKLSGDDASTAIVNSSISESVAFDAVDAARFKLQKGDIVDVAPEDTARNFPTRGKLVGFNKEEVVIEVAGSKGTLRCHFPRLGFFVKQAGAPKL